MPVCPSAYSPAQAPIYVHALTRVRVCVRLFVCLSQIEIPDMQNVWRNGERAHNMGKTIKM